MQDAWEIIYAMLITGTVTTVLGQGQKGTPYGNKQCAKWCAAHFPKAGAHCASLAAHGKGPCYDCGPLKPSTSSKQLCSGACTDTNTDNKNCGHCRTVVSWPRTGNESGIWLMWHAVSSRIDLHFGRVYPDLWNSRVLKRRLVSF